MSDWICLNVGGTIFETTRTTLTSVPGSLLAKMFDVDSSLPPASTSEDGTFRIDADPRAFSVILYWLRYKSLFLGKDIEAEAVTPVADYFGLQDLCQELKVSKEAVTYQTPSNKVCQIEESLAVARRIEAKRQRPLEVYSGKELLQLLLEGKYFMQIPLLKKREVNDLLKKFDIEQKQGVDGKEALIHFIRKNVELKIAKGEQKRLLKQLGIKHKISIFSKILQVKYLCWITRRERRREKRKAVGG